MDASSVKEKCSIEQVSINNKIEIAITLLYPETVETKLGLMSFILKFIFKLLNPLKCSHSSEF